MGLRVANKLGFILFQESIGKFMKKVTKSPKKTKETEPEPDLSDASEDETTSKKKPMTALEKKQEFQRDLDKGDVSSSDSSSSSSSSSNSSSSSSDSDE